jgi:hypothetical protein
LTLKRRPRKQLKPRRRPMKRKLLPKPYWRPRRRKRKLLKMQELKPSVSEKQNSKPKRKLKLRRRKKD